VTRHFISRDAADDNANDKNDIGIDDDAASEIVTMATRSRSSSCAWHPPVISDTLNGPSGRRDRTNGLVV